MYNHLIIPFIPSSIHVQTCMVLHHKEVFNVYHLTLCTNLFIYLTWHFTPCSRIFHFCYGGQRYVMTKPGCARETPKTFARVMSECCQPDLEFKSQWPHWSRTLGHCTAKGAHRLSLGGHRKCYVHHTC